jgi:phospho-N-acetylmuramoyl-pentapeptide-transferase
MFAFAVVMLIAPPIIRHLIRLKVGDTPEFDHAQLNAMSSDKANVPTMGGVMIVVSVLVSSLLFADPFNFYVQMAFVCMLWLTAVGAADDWMKLAGKRRSGSRDGLRSHEKLLFQIGLGVVLGYFIYNHGRVNHAAIGPQGQREYVEAFRVLMVPFYKHGLLLGTYVFMLVTVIVVTGTSNAVNLTDGLDGLASGCVAICCGVFMLLSHASGQADIAAKLLIPYVSSSGELAVICGAMMGACLGFLWFNCNPAQVFMGDTGSLPLGGLIGYIAIVTRQELMLFLVGGVFVVEAVSVMLQVGCFKVTGGKRLFLMAPIHHHFQLKGWTEPQTVVRFWLVGGLFAVFALATVKLR